MIDSFNLAIDNVIIIISKSKIRQLLNTLCSHIWKMTKRQKMMCDGETCIIDDDMQQSVNLFRKKYIEWLISEIEEMPRGREQRRKSDDLLTSITQVCDDLLGEIPK
jgi:hypothetical protein